MLFLDTTYIVGLIIDNDDYHNQSIKLQPYLKDEFKIINNTVLNEVLNSLKKSNSKIPVDKIINKILGLDKVYFLSDNDYYDSISLFQYYNQAINFSDCTILKTMQDHQINNIVSFDTDFDKIKGINRIYL